MTDPPFGFGLPGDPDRDPDKPDAGGGAGAAALAARAAAPAAPAGRWDRSATRSSSPMPCASSPT